MIRLKIKEVAEARGLKSASDLARKTGLSFKKANKLWHGEISDDPAGKRSTGILVLLQVAQALKVTTKDLYEEGEPEQKRLQVAVAPTPMQPEGSARRRAKPASQGGL